ncbi:MAG: DinB family protein [Thermoplasmata archaeon]|nr:DinB family protein [Thermoplasmata archaeon]
MTNVADFRMIYEYNWRVLRDYADALAKLPRDAVRKDRGATHGSMQHIFHHILSVHDGWLNVTAQGVSADAAMRERDFKDVDSMEPLRTYLEKIVAREKAFLATLNDKDLERKVQPEWKERPHALRDALMQVTFEQAHHIGELIALFWQIDVEPPEMTWIDVRLLMKGDPGPS